MAADELWGQMARGHPQLWHLPAAVSGSALHLPVPQFFSLCNEGDDSGLNECIGVLVLRKYPTRSKHCVSI